MRTVLRASVSLRCMARRTWEGSIAPLWQAEPPLTARPRRSSAMISASESKPPKRMEGRIRQPRRAFAMNDDLRHRREQRLLHLPAHGAQRLTAAIAKPIPGVLCGGPKAHQRRYVFRTGAAAAFLRAAMQHRLQPNTLAHPQRACPQRPMHLVRRNGQQIAAKCTYIDRHLAARLNGVSVQQGAAGVRDLRHLANRLEDARLVVCEHQAYQPRLGLHGIADAVRIDAAVTLWSDHRDLHAALTAAPLPPVAQRGARTRS